MLTKYGIIMKIQGDYFMKRFIFALLALLLVGCSCKEKRLDPPFWDLKLPTELDERSEYSLPITLTYQGKEYTVIYYTSNLYERIGVVANVDEDTVVTIKGEVTIDGEVYSFTHDIKIKNIDEPDLNPFKDLLVYTTAWSEQDMKLPKELIYKGESYPVTFTFTPDLVQDGIAAKVDVDTMITATAKVVIKGVEYEKQYEIKIRAPEATDPAVEAVVRKLEIPETAKVEIDLPKEYVFPKETLRITYQSSDETLLTNEGKVLAGRGEYPVELTASIEYYGNTYTHTYNINIVDVTATEALNDLKLPEEVDDDIELPSEVRGYHIDWFSDNERVLSATGLLSYVSNPVVVTLNGMILDDDEMPDRDFAITAKPYNGQRRLEAAMEVVDIPSYITRSLKLELPYDVEYKWQSIPGGTISEDGVITRGEYETQTTLILYLIAGENSMMKYYDVTIEKQNITSKDEYNILHRVGNGDFQGTFSNLTFENERLGIENNKTEGYYESPEIPVTGVTGVEGSYSVSSYYKDANNYATGELLVRLKVGSTWSQYFTYGQWGLGKQHSSLPVYGDAVASMDTDMISVKNGQVASAVQYKVILKRSALEAPSPTLALVNISLRRPVVPTKVNINTLPREVDYDVPKLNQNEVPSIGSSICSGTSSTMLLKYKGYNFSDKDVYENRYVSYLLWDYRIGYPGNWVFNTHGMSGFGEISYVRRIYHIEDMLYHLAYHGPMAASISGNVYHQEQKLYNTGGHLIVVRGYRIDNNGNITILVNDPNVNSRFGSQFFVYIEMTEAHFKEVWRGVFYVIE